MWVSLKPILDVAQDKVRVAGEVKRGRLSESITGLCNTEEHKEPDRCPACAAACVCFDVVFDDAAHVLY